MTDSDDHYRELWEESPTGQLTVDGSGTVTAANRTLLTWLRREPTELIGAAFLSLLSTADQLFYETRFAPVLRLNGEAREVSLSLLGAEDPLPVLLNARLVAGREGGAEEIRMSIFDSTQRRDYERQLLNARREAEESEARVRTLQRASTAFGASEDEATLADELVEITRDAMAAPDCAVLLVDENGETTLVAGRHPLRELAADPALADEIASLRAVGTIALGDIEEVRSHYPLIAEGLAGSRIEAFSVVPIPGDGRVVGALMCFFRRPRSMSSDDLDVQLALARQAGQSLVRLRLQAELRMLALHDQLTGLANRRLLRELLIQGMAAAARRELPIALLVLDLDGFKSVNDALGHQAGDAMLRWVGEQISGSVRTDDVVGRFGGDEFLVVCHDADASTAEQVAERIRAAIAAHPDGLPDGAPLSASVGIAICEPEQTSVRPEDFFAVADAALYRSKGDGKDRITIASV